MSILVGKEAILKEKIPYWLIPVLPHAHALAHGEANLAQPLRMPGRNSIVGEDYWKNVKNYNRIQQPARASRDIGMSYRRPCSKCKSSGIVQLCPSCSRWFHDNDSCHDFNMCDGKPTNNPYVK